MFFSVNGSGAIAHASSTWYCQALRASTARARLGAEVARIASEATSGGTGEIKSGRCANKEMKAASSRLRK